MPDEKLSIQMISLSSATVVLFTIIFQIIMPPLPQISDFGDLYFSKTDDPTFNMIAYVSTSSLHIIFSIFFSFHLWINIKKNSPYVRFNIKRNIAISSFIVISLIIIFSIAVKLKIVTYSHDRTLSVFQNTYWGEFISAKAPSLGVSLFSFFPVFLVLCGVAFSVVACVWSAAKSIDIIENKLIKQEVDFDEIWSEISIFSIIVSSVFLTSTLSTIFYLNLGAGLSKLPDYNDFYRNSANGMSILWGACFSIIMIIIVLYPLKKMNESAQNSQREHRVLGKDITRFKFIYGVLSTDRIIRIIFVLFSPVYISAMNAIIN